jgi:hypothetical protein
MTTNCLTSLFYQSRRFPSITSNIHQLRSCGTRSDNIYQFKHTIWINILMTQLKKKTAQNHANVRKHCLWVRQVRGL